MNAISQMDHVVSEMLTDPLRGRSRNDKHVVLAVPYVRIHLPQAPHKDNPVPEPQRAPIAVKPQYVTHAALSRIFVIEALAGPVSR